VIAVPRTITFLRGLILQDKTGVSAPQGEVREMSSQRRIGGHDPLPRRRKPEFVDVSEEWLQLGSDWLANVFPSLKSRLDEEGRDDHIPPRRVKH
jgi:hypothetical protein